MKRLSFIENLDDKIEGGIPCPSSTLIYGPSGTGKSLFSYQFISCGARNSQPSILVTTETSPGDVKSMMNKYGWSGDFIIVDLYSWKSSERSNCKYSLGGMDLNKLNIVISSALRDLRNESEDPGRLVFDSLSGLFLYLPEKLVMKFLSTLKAKIESKNFAQFVIIEGGTADKKTMATASSLCDGQIKFRETENGQKQMRIEELKMTNVPSGWIEFGTTKEGIKIFK